jgi:hypothetical protein
LSDRNPEIQYRHGPVDLVAIIRDAIFRFWNRWVSEYDVDNQQPQSPNVPPQPKTDLSFEGNERLARRLFFDLPSDGKDGSMACLARSCVPLCFDIHWRGDVEKTFLSKNPETCQFDNFEEELQTRGRRRN